MPLSPSAPFTRLWPFVRPYRFSLALGAAATLLSGALGLVFPHLFGRLIDASFLHVGSRDAAALNRTVLSLLAIFAVAAAAGAWQSWLLARVGAGVVTDLRRTLFAHLLELSPRFFGRHSSGDLVSRLTADVSAVQGVSSTALAQAFTQLITMLGAAILLLLTSPQLSALALLLIPLLIGVAAFFGRRVRAASRDVQDQVAAASAVAAEVLSGVRVVQSFTAQPLEERRYASGLQASYAAALRRAQQQAFMSGLLSFLSFSALALLLWYGGRQVMSGQLSPGQLVSFLFYAMQLASSVAALSGLLSQWQEALGASGRVFELLDERPDLPRPAQPLALTHCRGEVSFRHVSFRYEEREVLSDIHFQVAPGEIIALVGPSGAGKSTLVSLLARFWDVTEGAVYVDGQDVRRYDLSALRSQIGLVPQETLLFSGTVAENIWYGRPQAPREEMTRAAEAAHASEFIARLENGYDTLVGERGVKLSGGQRQRIAIARAILKNPRILILDEATSALDNESEALVQGALEQLMRGRTTFIIAHRLSTVRRAQRILVMDGGRIIEAGSHEELYAAGGLYRRLYERQFRPEAAL